MVVCTVYTTQNQLYIHINLMMTTNQGEKQTLIFTATDSAGNSSRYSYTFNY